MVRPIVTALLVGLVIACSSAAPTPSLSAPPDGPGPEATGSTAPSESPPEGPSTAPIESVPPPPADSGPTSEDLIRAALAAGTIDEPTSLLYRVYAVFSDLRLPEEYRTPLTAGDDWAMFEAQTTIDSLPPAIADELRPFLARPTAPESVFHGPAQTSYLPLADPFAPQLVLPALGNPYGPGNFVCDSGSWGHIEGGTTLAGGPAWKVWGVCNDTASINDVVTAAGYMDLLYGPEVALLGPPKPDTGGGLDEAGDGALDVYLISSCISRAGRCMGTDFRTDSGIAAYAQTASPCETGPAARCSSFIVIPRATIVSPIGASTVAHEVFHTLEFNHNASGLFASGTANWFTEASAVWAEHYFYPAGRPAAVDFRFTAFQSGPYGLSDASAWNEYDSYAWPLFMQQLGGKAKIAAAWLKIEGQVGDDAVNAAIDSTLFFSSNFREFAVRTWNEPLTPAPDPIRAHLWDLDAGLTRSPPGGKRMTTQQALPANKRGTAPLQIHESIPLLGARYSDLVPEKDVQQITVDFSNLTASGDFDVDALLWIQDTGWERRQLDKGKTRFCRTVPEDDVLELIIVLANHEYTPGHEVTGYWTVESLEDPCSGWDVNISWTDVYNGVADTITFVGVVDEVDPDYPVAEGTVYLKGYGTASGARGGWKACNPGIEETPQGTAGAFFQAILSDETITISAFADFDTVLSGISTAPMEVPVEGGTATYGNVPGGSPSPGATPTPTPLVTPYPCVYYSYGTMTATPYEVPAP